MSWGKVHYCTTCGTIGVIHKHEPKCCPDGHQFITDMEVAKQAQIGRKLAEVLGEISHRRGNNDEWKLAIAKLMEMSTPEIVDAITVFELGRK